MEAFNAMVYTDGSCHTQSKIGAWVAILLIGTDEIILSETVIDTTHNRMELTAVIAAIQYVLLHYRHIAQLQVFSDSQYVINLPDREATLMERNFITQKGNELQNTSLVKLFLQLLTCISVEFVKIKAHQKKGETTNYNIKADRLSRKLVRQENAK